jgi:hypothetical protein
LLPKGGFLRSLTDTAAPLTVYYSDGNVADYFYRIVADYF